MANQALIKPIESLKRSGVDRCVILMNRFGSVNFEKVNVTLFKK